MILHKLLRVLPFNLEINNFIHSLCVPVCKRRLLRNQIYPSWQHSFWWLLYPNTFLCWLAFNVIRGAASLITFKRLLGSVESQSVLVDVRLNNSFKSVHPKLSFLLRIEINHENFFFQRISPVPEEYFDSKIPLDIKSLLDLLFCYDWCWLLVFINVRLIKNIGSRRRPRRYLRVNLFETVLLIFLINLLNYFLN